MRLESLWGDIRFAFRIFKRSPAVALTVIGTLAVALGLNATAYSFFNAYVVKPAAVHDPGTLYQASWENRGGFFHRFSWTEAARFGREMAGVFPETYVSTAQLLTRINGRPPWASWSPATTSPCSASRPSVDACCDHRTARPPGASRSSSSATPRGCGSLAPTRQRSVSSCRFAASMSRLSASLPKASSAWTCSPATSGRR